MKYTTD